MNKRELRQLLCSMLLGDGCLRVNNTPKHTGAEFRTEHSIQQEDYLDWKVSLLDACFISKNLPRRCKKYTRSRFDKRTGRTYHSATAVLAWKAYFTRLHSKVYTSKGKNVEFLLSNVSSDLHLAIWFMDDVSESRSKAKHKDGTSYYKNPYFRLATHSFTSGQCNLIKQWFESNYSVSPNITIQRSGPILQFSVQDTKKLFQSIRVYLSQIESMREKKFRLCFERY